jgi:hypothetical protein
LHPEYGERLNLMESSYNKINIVKSKRLFGFGYNFEENLE